MKYQVLFSLKNNEKVFIYVKVVCCSRDRRFKGQYSSVTCSRCFYMNDFLVYDFIELNTEGFYVQTLELVFKSKIQL